jgi:hypothetical protein
VVILADCYHCFRYEQSAHPTMPSFAPINAMQAPVQFISPQKTLHERDIFDVVEASEGVPDVSASMPKKRGRAQSKGRAVSVDPLWEYVDEGDLASHNNGDDFETTFPKRRKPASAKRSKSMKATPSTLSLFWPKDETHPAALDASDLPTSQLTKPPDSGNAKKKRATSAKSRPSKPKMGPFKAPTITKPAISKQKEVIEEAVEAPVQSKPISYLGHTTTQQTVMLSQTTLDRLAAFRYIPPAALQSSGPSTDMHHRPDAGLCADGGERLFNRDTKQNYITEDNDCHESTGYEAYSRLDEADAIDALHKDNTPSNDAFLEAAWHVQTSSQFESIGLAEEERGLASTLVPEPSSDVLDSGSQLHSKPSEEETSTINQCNQSLQQNEPPPGIELHGTTARMQFTRSSSQHEPEPSEDRVLPIALDAPDNNHAAPGGAEESLELPSLPQDQISTTQKMPDTNTEMPPNATGVPSSEIQQEEPSSQVLPALNSTHHRRPNVSNRAEVERSNIGDVVIEKRDQSKDYDIDDYDGGLNDSDLLDLASLQIVPATQSDPVEKRSSEHGSTFQQQKSNGEYHDPNDGHASVPDVITIDTDDEFALDDDIEEEMMHFDFEVVERFQPPASVQLTSDGGSTRGEVYDKRPRFSSPNRIAVSPNQQTNFGSVVQSPASVPELSVDNAEDWSFISSQNISNAPRRPLANSARTSLKGAEEAAEVSPPKPTLVLGSSMKREDSASQLTMATIHTLLDDSHEYEPLRPFARPDFPGLVRHRSPVVGLSPQVFLRVCFRVAEMLKEGARRNALQENAIIELFARVTHSDRESGTSKQHFHFADLWHDRPPFPSGILANYKTPDLLRAESKVFIGAGEAKMARCFGRLKKDGQSSTGWLLDMISIRTTDWEEIKWTKRIVSAGLFKSEK